MPKPPGGAGVGPALILLGCVLTMLVWSRVQIGNGYTVLLGDWLDGRIQVSLTEHWYNVVRGIEPWDKPGYLYPWKDTLGYNDGFFLYGMLGSVFRYCGIDPFLAFELAATVVRAAGFVGCALFASDVMRLGRLWAILAAAVFTLAGNAYLQEGHGQLLTVAFAPLLGWLVWRTVEALRNRADRAAVAWGAAAAALYGGWLLTGYYMAWFTTFFAALLVLAAAPAMAAAGVGGLRRYARWPLAAIAVVAALFLWPFLHVYLPKARETGGHVFAAISRYLPAPLDLLHIGSDNWLFGGLDTWMTAAFRPGYPPYGEQTIGFAPLLVLLALGGWVQALVGVRTRPGLWRAMAVATLASFVLVLHVPHNESLWRLVWQYVPGAKGVRVTARLALFLTLPVTLLAVGFLASLARRWPAWIVATLAAILVLEELTSMSPARLDRAHELQLVADVPRAPAACRSFFVSAPLPRESTGNAGVDALYPHNVDAMLIAEERGIPTINGFATFNPPDWVFDDIDKPDYLDRVRRYAGAHRLRGLCSLDLAKGGQGVWDTAPFAAQASK